MNARWLAILGIGEDGLAGLSAAARALLEAAALVVGGHRHLALAAPAINGERLPWPTRMEDALPVLRARRPEPVAVLASGDPYCFGAGAWLARHVPAAETICIPSASAFALACAQLGWPLQDCATISFCGRPIEALAPLLQPGARILALSADAATPAHVAAYIAGRGFAPSRLHVLEALGGPRQRVTAGLPTHIDPLNMLAIEVIPGPDALPIPLTAGLPDELFETDGQITKREIRAITLSSLAPLHGQLLWDVGCGSGSVGIEWMLRHPANRTIAIEQDPGRAARAARNAAFLGVPALRVVQAPAPDAFTDLPTPDAIFVGGGGHAPGLLDAVWQALRPGGRLVANAITIESEAALLAARDRLGGALTRIAIERLDRIGSMHGYRPAMTVTQFVADKP